MKLFSKIRKHRTLKNAVKSANEPVWFIQYETQDGEGMVNVYANSHKSALKNADSIIRIQDGNKPYAIKSVSAV